MCSGSSVCLKVRIIAAGGNFSLPLIILLTLHSEGNSSCSISLISCRGVSLPIGLMTPLTICCEIGSLHFTFQLPNLSTARICSNREGLTFLRLTIKMFFGMFLLVVSIIPFERMDLFKSLDRRMSFERKPLGAFLPAFSP